MKIRKHKPISQLLAAGAVLILMPNAVLAHQGGYIGFGAGQSMFSSDLGSEKWNSEIRALAGIDPTLTTRWTSEESDDKSLAGKIYGGYDFNDSWALEAFYVDFGEVEPETAWNGTGAARSPSFVFPNAEGVFDGGTQGRGKVSAQAIGISGIGKIPVSNWFRAFAKIGAYYYESQLNGSWTASGTWESIGLVGPNTQPYNRGGGNDEATSGFSWLFGFGVGFTIAEHIGINLEWESYQNLKNDYPAGASDAYDINLVSASVDYKF